MYSDSLRQATIFVWGRTLQKTNVVINNSTNWTQITPFDEKEVVWGGEFNTKVTDLGTGQVTAEFDVRSGYFRPLIVIDRFIFVSSFGSLCRYERDTKNVQRYCDPNSTIDKTARIDFPEGPRVLTIGLEGVICIWDPVKIDIIRSMEMKMKDQDHKHFIKISDVAVINSSEIIVAYTFVPFVSFFDLETAQQKDVELSGNVRSLDVSEGKVLLTLKGDKGIVVLDTHGEILLTLTSSEMYPSPPVKWDNCARFIDINHILILSKKGAAQIWDIKERKMQLEIPFSEWTNPSSMVVLPLEKSEEREMREYFTNALVQLSPLIRDMASVVAGFI